MKKITFLILASTFAANAQDDCMNAEVVTAGTYMVEEVNGPTVPAPDCSLEDTVATASEWFAFTSTVNGVINVSSAIEANSDDTDTRLNIYSGECGALTCVAHDDDVDLENFDFRSDVTFATTAGTTYYISFDNGWSDEGFSFSITEHPVNCATDLPFSTTFEDPNFLVGCYQIEDVDENGVSWTQQSFDLNEDGTNETFAINGTNSLIQKNDWLFSPMISLNAGTTYTISYTYNGLDLDETNMAHESLEVVIANAPSSEASFMQQLGSYENITQFGTLATLMEDATTQTVTFTPATSGNYNLGFHTTTEQEGGYLLLFGYSIEVQLSTPEFGTEISVYPNPVRDQVTIAMENIIDSVEVYNLMGQNVFAHAFDTNEVNIDLSGISSGAYVVKVKTGNSTKMVKLVKQ
ncbi:MAG TPA: T9SS type A sorting domain-containing protein [Flavobacterium sp.]|jgi:hypothetical protein